MKQVIYIAAGGTGGHINAALSLGQDFQEKYDVRYLTGTRYLDYQLFENLNVAHLESKPLKVKNPLTFIVNTFKNLKVFLNLLNTYRKTNPKFLIGAGGYVCGPSLLAAKILGIKIFIIEQNATLGLTNKILSLIADRIFVHFKNTKGLESNKRVVVAGNPIRKNIQASKQIIEEGKVKILIYGGSLGARQINQAVELLKDEEKNFEILHQVGKSNYSKAIASTNYKQVEYINDMQRAYDWANIIIARAGASTVAELKVVGKPCILIPFPGHSDNHQVYNAQELKKSTDTPVVIIDNKLSGVDLKNKIKESIEAINIKNINCVNVESIDTFAVINKEIEECME